MTVPTPEEQAGEQIDRMLDAVQAATWLNVRGIRSTAVSHGEQRADSRLGRKIIAGEVPQKLGTTVRRPGLL